MILCGDFSLEAQGLLNAQDGAISHRLLQQTTFPNRFEF